jgi:hypothetical protein
VIARIAARSHGVVTWSQLLGAGISEDEIRHRLHIGVLIREHRGVYRVGHRAPSVEALYLAAVFACGDGALLCGRATAHLQSLIKGGPPPPEVMSPVKRRLRGVITHRVRHIDAEDATVLRGIPLTTVPRTLVDIAGDMPEDDLARACHEAGVRYRTTPRHVEAVLARRPNAQGASKLRGIISGDTPLILSKLEKGFLRRLRQAGLPLPKTNRPAGAHYVDCRWPDRKLTVELDSYRFHSSRHAWEQDRRRERDARGRGDEFRRYVWRDVFEEPEFMLAELRRLLSTACAGSSTA